MQSDPENPRESWAEALNNISPIAVVILPLILIRLGLVARADRFALTLVWVGNAFLVLFYLPYRLRCWAMPPDKRPAFFRFCAEASRKDWLFFFCVITISYIFVGPANFVGGRKYLGTTSVRENDSLLWSPAAYVATPPTRGDIVVYNTRDGTHHVRRIVGLPGETIEIDGGRVVVNDTPLDESYIHLGSPETPGSTFRTRTTLGTDEYIILADDRSELYKHEILAKRKHILGKAFFRYSPVRDFGLLPDVMQPRPKP